MSDGASKRWSLARRLLGLTASVAFSAMVLVLLWRWHGLGFDQLLHEWRAADKTLLLIVVVGSAAFHIFVGAHKQGLILRSMGVDIRFGEMLRVRLGTGPLRLMLPLSAGEYVQIVYFWGHRRMPLGHASGALVFDRGLNLLGATFWLALGFAVLPDVARTAGAAPRAPLLRWGLFVGVLVLYALIFFVPRVLALGVRLARRIHRKVGDLAEGLAAPFVEFSVGRKLLLVVYGIVFQLRPLLVCLGLLAAYHLPHQAEHVMAYGSIAVFAGYTPGAMAGMGPREVAVVQTFSRLGAPADALFSVGLLMTFAQNVLPMMLGVPWLIWFVRRLRRREPTESEERPWTSAAK
ncbi:MAG: flippase-like domain-containing protein [Deltaproteobacteria bacterium]|nr:flippase-like domain-containing protein [Deltaproteobacteria bacterium]